MNDLEEEIIALSEIFGNDFALSKTDTSVGVTLPLRFKWQLNFILSISESKIQDVSVSLFNSDCITHQHHRAAEISRSAAACYMTDRKIPGYRSIYAAHQNAVDEFDQLILQNHVDVPAHLARNVSLDGADKAKQSILDGENIIESDIAINPQKPIDLETTVIILDHINDSKRYYGALQDFSQQLLLSCIVLAKNPTKGGDRIKYAIVIIQSSDNNDKFLTLLKSENVDVNKAGKPCKERCSSTLLATRQYGAFEADNVFKVVDCSTADALEMIRNKYHAADVSKVIQEFCSGKR